MWSELWRVCYRINILHGQSTVTKHSRSQGQRSQGSLEMSPFDSAHTTSYTGSISCRFCPDIQCRKMSWPWNRGQRSLKVIESGVIRIVYGFLLVFVPKTHIFWDIRLVSIQYNSITCAVFPICDFKNVVTWKSGSEVTQGQGKYTVTLEPGLGVSQGHQKWYHSIRHPWLNPINVR